MTAQDDPARSDSDHLAELRQAVLDDWIVVTTRTAGALHAIQQTVSWRVTKPLRMVKRFQRASDEYGFGRAAELTAASVARRLGRK